MQYCAILFVKYFSRTQSREDALQSRGMLGFSNAPQICLVPDCDLWVLAAGHNSSFAMFESRSNDKTIDSGVLAIPGNGSSLIMAT